MRAHLRGLWSAVAGGWAEHAAYIDARSAPVTAAMLRLTDPRAGDRVLELACGPGGVGLAAAERVAPGGEVVLTDVVPEMTEIAAARAAALGHANVVARVRDLEAIDEPSGAYDVVLCREGLMFVPDPARAARGDRPRHAPRRPRRDRGVGGARAQPLARPRARRRHRADRHAGPAARRPRAVLARRPRRAGAAARATPGSPTSPSTRSRCRCAPPTFDEWWARTTALAGPLGQRLAALPDDAARAVRERARRSTAPFATAAGLELPGVTLLASRGAV